MDSFLLTHEQIHATSMDANITNRWIYFTELPTILSEMLLQDFLVDNKHSKNEIKKAIVIRNDDYIARTLCLKMQVDLIKTVIDEGCINKYNILDIINNCYNTTSNMNLTNYLFNDVLNKVYGDSDEFFYFFDLRYTVGIIVASYLHDKIINNPALLREFSIFNENFKYWDIEQCFELIGLDLNLNNGVLDLSDESYKKLEKSYIKELRRQDNV